MRTGLSETRRLLRTLTSLIAQVISISRPVVVTAGRSTASSIKRTCGRAWLLAATWTRRWAWPRVVAAALFIRRQSPVVGAAIARFSARTAQSAARTGRAVLRTLVAASKWTYARTRSGYDAAWDATTSGVGRATVAIWHGSVRASAAVAVSWSIVCAAWVKMGHAAFAFARVAGVATLRMSRVIAAFIVVALRAGARQTVAWVRRTRIWAQQLRGSRLPVNLRARLRPDQSWAHPFASLSTHVQGPDWLRAPAWSKSSRWRHPFAEIRLVSAVELVQKPDWVRKPAWLKASTQREHATWSNRLKWSITPEWLRRPAWLAAPTWLAVPAWLRRPDWLRKPAWLVTPSWLRKPAWLRAVDLRRNIVGPAIVAMMVIVAAVFTAVVYSSPRSGASPGPIVSPVVDESSAGPGTTTYLSAAPVERSTAPDGQVVVVPVPASTTENGKHKSTTTKQSAAPSAKATSVILPITYPIYVFPVTSPSSATPTFIFVQPTSPTTHAPAPGTTSATKTSTAPTTSAPVTTTPVKTVDPPPVITTTPVKTVDPPPVITTTPVKTVDPPPVITADPVPPPVITSTSVPPVTTTPAPDPITVIVGELLG
jgi:hypothetical protein